MTSQINSARAWAKSTPIEGSKREVEHTESASPRSIASRRSLSFRTNLCKCPRCEVSFRRGAIDWSLCVSTCGHGSRAANQTKGFSRTRSGIPAFVDDVEVWVVPCITVRKQARGRGVALALIEAAVDHAARHGAPAVEAYARAGAGRVHDDFAYFGTEPLFRRAGFRMIRKPLPGMPKGWTPRVTMRREC
jgi:GNAT superfamily N-acetyltransferase